MSVDVVPEGKYADVGEGLRIHYQEQGEGKPLLFLHGSGPGASGFSNFKGNYPFFAERGYRVIVPDTLGYGYSSKPADRDYGLDFLVGALHRFTRALGLERCAVVGNSHGGAMAIKLALDHPALVEKLVLMAPGGSDIRISDFGAALHTARETTQIAGVGSPAYMSPQQVREVPLDHRTDIYSLGVVMFQLLTGHLPFEQENSYSLLYSIANDTPPPPSELRPEVPEALDAIVRRATEKDVERRYQSWSEFSHDLALAFRNRSLALAPDRLGDTGKFEALRTMRFFRRFADAELWEVIGLSRFDRALAGTVIIKEGERGDAICFVLAGEARVSKQGRLLEVLNPGDCFGEIAVFSTISGVRSASVEAAADTELVTIRARALERASETLRMHFYQAFLEVLATRLSQASARIANL